MITTLAIEGYRSLRRLVVPLTGLTVITGANGSGKSSVYRSLRLLAESSRNGATAAVAREGGLESVLWAGPETLSAGMRSGSMPVQGTRRSGPVALKLGFASGPDSFSYASEFGEPVPSEFGYTTEFGIPVAGQSFFNQDPEIKAEAVFSGPFYKPSTSLTERHGPAVRIRSTSGEWEHHDYRVSPFDSMLSEFSDPRAAPELFSVRETLRGWRFYDHVRTDADAPARRVSVGSRTPVLSADGSDLAAALQTIREMGVSGSVDKALGAAFPGARLDPGLELSMRQPGLLRPLRAPELSDGTLRYLLWIAALLSPRPPRLLVLNEPETSLHPELIDPLAGLIAQAAQNSQVIVVSHSRRLVDALDGERASRIELEKHTGETRVVDQGILDEPAWHWPKR